MCSYILQTIMDKYLIKVAKKRTFKQSSVGNKPISNETPSLSSKKVYLEFNPEEQNRGWFHEWLFGCIHWTWLTMRQ